MSTDLKWAPDPNATEEERLEAHKIFFKQMMEELELLENADIREELNDRKFKSRTHGARSTYAQGCRGPLCKKAERDRARRKHEIKMLAQGKSVSPLPPRKGRDRDEFLQWILGWHRGSRRSNPANRFRNNIKPDFDPLYTREADRRALLEAERAVNHQQTA